MEDYLVRAVSGEGECRAVAVVTTGVVEEARRRHGTWPVVTAALGRTLTAALLLGANLKGDDLLTLRVLGDGPVGAIVVTANGRGEVRGYVQEPRVDLPGTVEGKLPVGAAVGKNGTLYVTRDLGLKEPFTGSVELVSGEIGEDVAQYLLVSEQTPSAVSLGVLVGPDAAVKASGGLLLQLFPGASENTLSVLEKNISALPPVSSLVDRGMSPEEIVALATAGLSMKVLDRSPVRFACKCSRERVEEVLLSLGREELEKLKRERGVAEVRCHFCGEVYHFSSPELDRLLQEAAPA
ncbi:MAG: Hsp33 family molecular chaperone HslO [Firmicutes bacterium]|nr:Hsp33 family molecular chaperone HslO [Bacillota bacterium]